MKTSLEAVGEITIFRLGRTLDYETRDLYEMVKEELSKGRSKFIVDFENVDLIWSNGVGYIVASFTAVKNAGGTMLLSNLSQKMMGVLEITKLYTVFEVYKSNEEALFALKQP